MRRSGMIFLMAGVLALAGCGGSDKSGASGPGGAALPKIAKMASLGAGEGVVNIVAWAGYVEDGSNDPKVDWVHDFEKETGCKVNSKIAGTSDEMVSLMKTGEYDVVSASGDASLRLIYDSTAEGFLALRRTATGVLLIDHPWRVSRPRHAPLRVPDLLPALINATRAFLTIGAASLVWIWTAWPSGATFLTFAVIAITMFAPQEDAAYAMARTFTAGTVLTVVFAAVIEFALLPQVTSFGGFCVVLGIVLVPAGALAAQPWQQGLFFAMQANFIPLLSPSNPNVYDPPRYYNSAMWILSGIAFAMLAMRLLPPMPPAWRARWVERGVPAIA